MTEEDARSLRRRSDEEMRQNQREHWRQISEIGRALAGVEQRLAGLAQRHDAHLEEQESERSLLRKCAEEIARHSVRLTTLERVILILWGMLISLASGGVGWIIVHLMGGGK